MPRALAVARAGAVLAARWRRRASSVLATVIAAVPRKPATSPSPIAVEILDGGVEAIDEMVADAQGIGHRGQRRVHGAAGGEEARVDDVEVVEVVGLAV